MSEQDIHAIRTVLMELAFVCDRDAGKAANDDCILLDDIIAEDKAIALQY